MIVSERSRDIGNFMVGRLLPFRKKRQVGPFTFIDHMGPSIIGPNKYIDVDQHPHIGLSTLTYLIEGEIEHRDSTGAVKVVKPGDVNFMTSGSGVAHTERTPTTLRNGKKSKIHGYQVWVALPKELEEMEPNFQFIHSEDLPTWSEGDVSFTLVAGEGFGRKAPLDVYSPLFMLDICAREDYELCIAGELKGEIAMVVVKGNLTIDRQTIKQGEMLISKTEDHCSVNLQEGTHLLLFGGEAFPEERFMYWNFVSSSKERLEQAKADWREKRFPKVPGDETYIPLP